MRCRPSTPVKRTGFSLLELLIVLTIMAAIGAVAWPSLRRPMADSSVQQAANQLREQIAEYRQSAAIQGQPRLMRFEAGLRFVGRGPWNDLVAQKLTDDNAVGGATEALGGSLEHPSIDSWELPEDIVVDEVQFDQRRYVEADPSSPASHGPDQVESKWYLPFLPSGQTRDAVIVLRDSVTGSRVALEIEAVTGSMRTQRLTAAMPAEEMPPAHDVAREPATAALHSHSNDRVYSR